MSEERKINLGSHNVLVINNGWIPLGTTTYQKALVSLNSQNGEKNAAKGLSIEYKQLDDNVYDFHQVESITPIESFEEWMKLPIRSFDSYVLTSRQKIRLPHVILTSYSKIPLRKFRPTKQVLYNLQNGLCGYSGKPISAKVGTIEHKTPRSFGGLDTFENLMIVHKDINHKRGNRPMAELGLVPLFNHKEPKPIPANYTIKQIAHFEWEIFLKK